MAVGFVAAASAGGNTATLKPAWPAGIADQDVALLAWTTSSSVTVTAPAGWTLVGSQTHTGNLRSELYVRGCDGSEAGSLSLVCSATSRQSAALTIWRGVDPVSPVGVYAARKEGSSSSSHAAPAVTLAAADSSLVTVYAERSTDGTSDAIPGSGYVERADTGAAAVGAGGTITAVAEESPPIRRAAGTTVTPPSWTSSFATGNVVVHTLTLRQQPPAAAPPVVVDTFSTTATVAGPVTIPVTRPVAAGQSILLATGRSDSAGAAGGVASITDSRSNTWTRHDAFSLMSGTAEVALHHAHLTTGLQAGDSITVTWNANANTRKVAVAHVVTGLDPAKPVTASSGVTVTSNPTDSGGNGQSTTPSVSSTASTTGRTFVLAALCSGVAEPISGAAYTAGAAVATTTGSADRQVTTEYAAYAPAGPQTADTKISVQSSYAMALAAYPTLAVTSPPTVYAGLSQTIEPWSTVTLTADARDSDGNPLPVAWTQTGGPPVTLSGSSATRTFVAPPTLGGAELTFTASATASGLTRTSAVTVTVLPVTERAVIGGVEVPMRIRSN